jgi:hypothetical protein
VQGRQLCLLWTRRGSSGGCLSIIGAQHGLRRASVQLPRRSLSESLCVVQAIELCQDTDYVVRVGMCSQLSALARAVGGDVTADVVLSEVRALSVLPMIRQLAGLKP